MDLDEVINWIGYNLIYIGILALPIFILYFVVRYYKDKNKFSAPTSGTNRFSKGEYEKILKSLSTDPALKEKWKQKLDKWNSMDEKDQASFLEKHPKFWEGFDEFERQLNAANSFAEYQKDLGSMSPESMEQQLKEMRSKQNEAIKNIDSYLKK